MNPCKTIKQKFQFLATGESFEVSPITSKEEKAILEMQAIVQDPDEHLDEICKIYRVPANLPEDIKLAALLKIREISNGSDCNIKFKCQKCKNLSEARILLENVLDFSYDITNDAYAHLKIEEPLGIFRDFSLSEIPGIFGCKLEDFQSLSELKLLEISLKARIPKLKESLPCKCFMCGYDGKLKLDRAFILKVLSEHSISSMYKAYHTLVINGFTKADVDGMLPFEREVHIGLIQQAIENIKEATGRNQQT